MLTAAIIIGTNLQSPYFLTALSIQNMLTFMAVLTLVCLAQLTVMLAGGIDLSVGPLMGLVVVLASIFMQDGLAPANLILWGGLILAGCTLYGLAQGLLIVLLRLPPITATLGTFVGLQGVSLLLRPTPGGVIAAQLANVFSAAPLGVPVAAWLALAVALGLEVTLLRTGLGRRLRAVGSQPAQCGRVGVNSQAMVVFSFVLSGFFSGLAGLILAGQIGMGTASAGVDYALMSITAVVLGGASVTGGRGSFIATLAGAALIQSTISASSFLQANTALQYVIVGGLTLAAAGIFSLVRHRRAAH
jgi:ribose transport system ATP-binding protein